MDEQKGTPEFSQFQLSKAVLKALDVQGYSEPSPIQIETIPAVLQGRDVLAAAQTGTGKTAAYTLPVLDRLSKGRKLRSHQMKALILAPTRELAAQIYDSVVNYSRYLDLNATVVYGGVKINPQMQRLLKGQDILVATPGRLLDLHRKNAVQFDQLNTLILDEADRMLNLGFQDEIQEILKLIPGKRQTLMFSATFSDEVRDLARAFVTDPVEITVKAEEITIEAIEQCVYPVSQTMKSGLFLQLMNDELWTQVLVFTKTKNRANHLVQKVEKAGYHAAAIHGDRSQGARTRALAEFKSGRINILIATDLAARGLDISGLPLVVNFDMPHLKEDYIHRIGRTGRAGAAGKALSFVCLEEFPKLKDVERLTQQVIPRRLVEGFQTGEILPESVLDLRPFKAKKPKKKKKKSIQS